MRRRIGTVILAVAALLSVMSLLVEPGFVDGPRELNLPLLFRLLGIDRIGRAFEGLPTLLAMGVVGVSAYCVLRFGLWWRARRKPGAPLLLAAAVLGTLPLIGWTVIGALLQPWYGNVTLPEWLSAASFAVARLMTHWAWTVPTISLSILSLGLLRSGIVPRGVGLVGVLAAVLSAAAQANLRLNGSSGLYMSAFIAETTFLVAVAVSLVWKEWQRSTGAAVEQAHQPDGAS